MACFKHCQAFLFIQLSLLDKEFANEVPCVWGLGVFFVFPLKICLNLLMFWASVQTVFFSLTSAFSNDISKQLVLTDHTRVCACTPSQRMTTCVSERLQGCSGHRGARSSRLLCSLEHGQPAAASLLKGKGAELPLLQQEQTLVPLLFHNWCSWPPPGAFFPSTSSKWMCAWGSGIALWNFLCISLRSKQVCLCLAWTLLLLCVRVDTAKVQQSGQFWAAECLCGTSCFNKDMTVCRRVAGSSLV